MNQSVCYDISQITDWRHLMEIETNNEEISIGRNQRTRTRYKTNPFAIVGFNYTDGSNSRSMERTSDWHTGN
ncbi:hypothetical protein RhiirA1_483351 [Rhizophagus irregularis]|uniref:Uncharacterized protein n=1 Tax=Rhizophagus irregularis TaxID=588596 RepID=A0A2I1FPU7_9GLOM|nr:hypothetical protein RhiirA1_483351 [Rhizophagus irregularis]PKY36381.1 hypothetical protein RhiirB3_458861 [Rhizophagus irregularis]